MMHSLRPAVYHGFPALLIFSLFCNLMPARAAETDIPRQLRINLAWQIALEAANFSPGPLDGHFGPQGQIALREYAASNFGSATSPFDRGVYVALKVDVDHATAPYTITDADAMAVGKIPDDWNEKAQLAWMPYESMEDELTEKFHCTAGLLRTLNPGESDWNVGTKIMVPNIRPFPDAPTAQTQSAENPKVSYLTVNLSEKTIRAFNQDNVEVALFHCSIARDKAKLPARDTVIKEIASDKPTYTFDPKWWPEVHNVDKILLIPPGPRNPIGLAWLSLDIPGYGIHGSPKPNLIGKTGSHGCFRLTNWDALKLASMVHIGMPVKMINPETQPSSD